MLSRMSTMHGESSIRQTSGQDLACAGMSNDLLLSAVFWIELLQS